MTARIQSESASAEIEVSTEIETALQSIVADCAEPTSMGYATKDLNQDGVEELVLLNQSSKLFAIFTETESVTVLLAQTGNGKTLTMDSKGTVYSSIFTVQRDFDVILDVRFLLVEREQYG